MGDRLRYSDLESMIRQDILSGAFVSGQRLKIAELAGRYGTSHMPIREALKLLSGEGLIEITPNRGVRVRTFDATFVANIFDIRIQIESLQARLAAERRSAENLAALGQARLLFEQHAREENVPALLRANRDFHRIIGEASRHREAAEVVDRHWRILPTIWSTRGYPMERVPMVIDDHRLLEQLIMDQDSEGASILAGAHCLRAKLHILRAAFSE